jgi:glycosyltransferase involved in cell wall biosynthesis
MLDQRIAVLSRTFWPNSSATELALGSFLKQLKLNGAEARLVTSQWDANWSTEFEFGEVPANRLPRSTGGAWAASRFVKAATSWLVQNCSQWEAVVVAGGCEELEAAIRARNTGGPRAVLMRLERPLVNRLESSPSMKKKFISMAGMADGLVVSDSPLLPIFAGLIGHQRKTHLIPHGVNWDPFTVTHGFHSKQGLRQSLSDVHPLLEIKRENVLALCHSDFQGERGTHLLVDAFAQVARHRKQALLWILGDGPQAREVWQQINDLEIVTKAVMVGNFDESMDPYLAADFFINPDREQWNHFEVNQAAACGLGTLFHHAAPRPEWFHVENHGWIATETDAENWAKHIIEIIDSGNTRREKGLAAQTEILDRLSWSKMIQQWSELIDLVLSRKVTSNCES